LSFLKQKIDESLRGHRSPDADETSDACAFLHGRLSRGGVQPRQLSGHKQGSYMATVAAGPVFRLLGAKDIGEKENYRTAKMPPVNTALLDGELAWRQRDGGHEDRSNMKHFIAWASRFLQHTPPAATATR